MGAGSMYQWELLLNGNLWPLTQTDLWDLAGSDLRIVLAAYLGVVIAILAAATTIRLQEGIGLRTILVAAFGWPLAIPVIVWQTLKSR
jgi:hypothetical protein